MSENFSPQEIAVTDEKNEEQNESGGSATLDDNNSQDFEASQEFFDDIKKEILMLDTKCIADYQDAERNEFLEKTGETENENSQPKNLDIEENDSEDTPLSLLRKKLFSKKVKNEAIKTIDTKNGPATDLQTNQSSKSYCCNKCHLLFKIKTDFENHMRIVHRTRKQSKYLKGEGRFKCKLCKNTYRSRAGLRYHEGFSHNINKKKKNYVCTICDKRFYTKQHLYNHEVLHTGKKNYACSLCSREFLRQAGLRTHVLAHTRDGNYYCAKCKKVFKDREEFRTHCRNHVTVKSIIECKICGKRFKQRAYLRSHAMLHKETEYKCTECGKDCKYEPVLHEHMRIHTGEKPFKCDKCSKTFRVKAAFRKHLRVHLAISYPCPQCDKIYKTKKFLQLHIDDHNGVEKPPKPPKPTKKFECDKCNKTYTRKISLQQHMRIHTGTKYKCDQCEKDFINIYNLRYHLACHEGDKNAFMCETCGSGFRTKQNYKRHLITHMGITYSCDKCGKTYKSKQSLTLHTNEKFCENKNKNPKKKYRTQKRHSSKPSEYSKSQRPPTKIIIKIENEHHVDTQLSEVIKIQTTRAEIDSFCEATDGPVIHLYKPKDLEDNSYFEITDECIIESSNNC